MLRTKGCLRVKYSTNASVGVVVGELPQLPGMISEAPELYVERGRISQSWCMYVVSHGCGGLDGDRDGGGGWYACWAKTWGLVESQEMLEHFPSAR